MENPDQELSPSSPNSIQLVETSPTPPSTPSPQTPTSPPTPTTNVAQPSTPPPTAVAVDEEGPPCCHLLIRRTVFFIPVLISFVLWLGIAVMMTLDAAGAFDLAIPIQGSLILLIVIDVTMTWVMEIGELAMDTSLMPRIGPRHPFWTVDVMDRQTLSLVKCYFVATDALEGGVCFIAPFLIGSENQIAKIVLCSLFWLSFDNRLYDGLCCLTEFSCCRCCSEECCGAAIFSKVFYVGVGCVVLVLGLAGGGYFLAGMSPYARHHDDPMDPGTWNWVWAIITLLCVPTLGMTLPYVFPVFGTIVNYTKNSRFSEKAYLQVFMTCGLTTLFGITECVLVAVAMARGTEATLMTTAAVFGGEVIITGLAFMIFLAVVSCGIKCKKNSPASNINAVASV